jgi:GT2 family glycosyltransferase
MSDAEAPAQRSIPLFSILTPVHNPPADVFAESILSVLAQSTGDWEWIVVDDASSPETVALLRELANNDARVRLIERSENAGIVGASQQALDAASGEFVVLLDHDDLLAERALETVASYLIDGVDYIYSDEGLLPADGGPSVGFYKPDWSPERLRSTNYCSHLSVLRTSSVRSVGGFREGFDGAQDHDLVLRVTELGGLVLHVPNVLYQWRQVASSVAADREAKPYAYEAGRRAVAEHCVRVGIDAEVIGGASLGSYIVRRAVPDVLTSVVIPTNGSTGRVWGVERTYAVEAIRSVVAHTTRRIEFIVVTDSDTPDDAVASMRRAAGAIPIQFVDSVGPFNFSEKVNLGAVHASGDVLLFLNDDTEVITAQFLDPMIPLALEDGVGAVGCMLVFADGRVQHAGHVYTGSTRHAFFGWSKEQVVPGDMLTIQRECIGVTAACMAVSKSTFADAGGFTPLLASNYNDVDFCLKLRHLGYRNIWTPYSELYHFESATREPAASPDEWDVIVRRWGDKVAIDPYSNPNLQPQRDDWVEAAFR